MPAVLVHLAAGIGDIVLATPLIVGLHELGLEVHLLLDADYPATAELFADWHVVAQIHARENLRIGAFDHLIPAVPPFYWPRYARMYQCARNAAARPPDCLFYTNVRQYYMHFAYALG